jgi:phosphoenolpyruvate-protein kinase (PTS system EI component)
LSGELLASGSAIGVVGEHAAPAEGLVAVVGGLGVADVVAQVISGKRAVICELGAPLSPASIVARVFALPMLAAPGARMALSPGDRVSVDADAGRVVLEDVVSA